MVQNGGKPPTLWHGRFGANGRLGPDADQCGFGGLIVAKLLARPDTLYGQGIGSNYQAQSLKLSKHFKA
jgi:hypothetical protein